MTVDDTGDPYASRTPREVGRNDRRDPSQARHDQAAKVWASFDLFRARVFREYLAQVILGSPTDRWE